jgi:hypothetical protein
MGEEYPSSGEEIPTDPAHEEPTLNEIQREEGGAAKRPSWLIIGGIVLVAVLILIGSIPAPHLVGRTPGHGRQRRSCAHAPPRNRRCRNWQAAPPQSPAKSP